jgi:outer membrane protein assembly factor BamB
VLAVAALMAAVAVLPGSPAAPATVSASVPTDADAATAYQQGHNGNGLAVGDALRAPLRALWSFTGGYDPSYTAIAAGRVFVVANSRLWALDARDGRLLWGPDDLGTNYFNGVVAYGDGVVVTTSSAGVVRAYAADSGRAMWAGYGAGNPIVANGMVYVSQTGVYSPGGVAAYRLSSGAVVWRTSNTNWGRITVTSKRVYTTAVSSPKGNIQAFDALTGRLLWTSDDPGTHGADTGISEVSGRVYVTGSDSFNDPILDAATGHQVGTFPENWGTVVDGSTRVMTSVARAGTTPIGVVAETSGGSRLWTFDGDFSSFPIPPVVANGTVFAAAGSGMVYALSEQSGRVLWSGRAGSGIGNDNVHNTHPLIGMSIGDGILTVPTNDGVAAFTSATGTGESFSPVPSAVPLQPIVPGATTGPGQSTGFQLGAAASGSRRGANLVPGLTTRWSHNFGDYYNGYPVIADGRVFVLAVYQQSTGPFRTTLFAMRESDGAVLWSRPMRAGGTDNALAYGDGRLFVTDQKLLALDPATGNQLWASTADWPSGVPAVAGGRVVVTGRDGTGYDTVDAYTTAGAHLWRVLSGYSAIVSLDASGAHLRQTDIDAGTGAVRWSCATTYSCGGGVDTGAVAPLSGGVEFDHDSAMAVNASTGALLGGFTSSRSPVVDGSVMVTASTTQLCAEDVATFRIRWCTGSVDLSGSPPLALDGYVYDTTLSGRLEARRESDGVVAWSTALPSRPPAQGIEPFSTPWPLASLGAGDGLLVVPNGPNVTAYTGHSYGG